MKYLDITLLVSNNSDLYAKSYLAYMHKAGYLPKKILLMHYPMGKHAEKLSYYIGKKNVYRLLRIIGNLRNINNTNMQKRLSYIIQQNFNVKVNYFSPINFSKMCLEYSEVSINNFSDPILLDYIEKEKIKTFLYTAGGIVTKDFLDINGVKVFHIHPGIVPEIKGSDGFFWSLVMHKKLGYSCFYMNSGIDTGDIIKTKEYQSPKIEIGEEFPSSMVYSTLLSFCDSHYRAMLFVDVLDKHINKDLNSIKALKQNKHSGRVFFTMHPKMISSVITKYFRKKND